MITSKSVWNQSSSFLASYKAKSFIESKKKKNFHPSWQLEMLRFGATKGLDLFQKTACTWTLYSARCIVVCDFCQLPPPTVVPHTISHTIPRFPFRHAFQGMQVAFEKWSKAPFVKSFTCNILVLFQCLESILFKMGFNKWVSNSSDWMREAWFS